jgi:hypothetical protein
MSKLKYMLSNIIHDVKIILDLTYKDESDPICYYEYYSNFFFNKINILYVNCCLLLSNELREDIEIKEKSNKICSDCIDFFKKSNFYKKNIDGIIDCLLYHIHSEVNVSSKEDRIKNINILFEKSNEKLWTKPRIQLELEQESIIKNDIIEEEKLIEEETKYIEEKLTDGTDLLIQENKELKNRINLLEKLEQIIKYINNTTFRDDSPDEDAEIFNKNILKSAIKEIKSNKEILASIKKSKKKEFKNIEFKLEEFDDIKRKLVFSEENTLKLKNINGINNTVYKNISDINSIILKLYDNKIISTPHIFSYLMNLIIILFLFLFTMSISLLTVNNNNTILDIIQYTCSIIIIIIINVFYLGIKKISDTFIDPYGIDSVDFNLKKYINNIYYKTYDILYGLDNYKTTIAEADSKIVN